MSHPTTTEDLKRLVDKQTSYTKQPISPTLLTLIVNRTTVSSRSAWREAVKCAREKSVALSEEIRALSERTHGMVCAEVAHNVWPMWTMTDIDVALERIEACKDVVELKWMLVGFVLDRQRKIAEVMEMAEFAATREGIRRIMLCTTLFLSLLCRRRSR